MADEESTPSTSPFDGIRHEDEQYGEYWSGKELYKLLGYSSWERFKGTIERAKISCEEAGQAASDHFHIKVKMITTGKGAKRKTEDVYLSRYACYLVLQNADPNGKPVVGMAQTYFAVQTRCLARETDNRPMDLCIDGYADKYAIIIV
jgi:DNA-damage-inducible protein D